MSASNLRKIRRQAKRHVEKHHKGENVLVIYNSETIPQDFHQSITTRPQDTDPDSILIVLRDNLTDIDAITLSCENISAKYDVYEGKKWR